MNKIDIYDPALCCSTGVCGPSVDPELLRVSTVLNVLKSKGSAVTRHNLSQEPQDFVSNETVRALLTNEGSSVLPITILNGEVVKKITYPTNTEFAAWLGIEESYLSSDTTAAEKPVLGCSCGASDECC